tara:strand:+ start:305 stop:733 length:429 start_codon:yes stop_codon:yes gene_type:complete
MLAEEESRTGKTPADGIQADREAAVAFLQNVMTMSWFEQRRSVFEVSNDRRSHEYLVGIFTEHRVRAENAARLEGIRMGVEAALERLNMFGGPEQDANFTYRRQASDISTALMSLSPEQIAARMQARERSLQGYDRRRLRLA